MERQRWLKIEQIYHSAQERDDPALREAFLADACGEDEELLREVKSLLGQPTSRGLLNRPLQELLGSSTASRLGVDIANPIAPGTLLGDRFRIVRIAGAGGMGFVYEAFDEKLSQHVALKCARSGFGNRLPPEVRAAREVSHFNVCKVHDLHTASTPQGEMEFLSMEFIAGQTLSERIARDGPVPESEAREIARQICSGLAQAHRQGVIHGDLKPGNVIIVNPSHGPTRAVITDFGMATMSRPSADPDTGPQGGTPDFMAPELFLGQSPAIGSDVYALGILFHVMLTGHPPPRAGRLGRPSSRRLLRTTSPTNTITTPPRIVASDWQRSVSDLSPPWDALVAKCISPRPEDRFPTAEAVSAALQPRRIALKLSLVAAAVTALALGLWQWRAAPAGPPVRLAVLPFNVEGDSIPGADGIGLDLTRRLSGARRNFSVIPPAEARRNGVTSPASARRVLGATHVLETHLRSAANTIVATAALSDLSTGRPLGQPLQGTFSAGDSAALAKALLATVTGGLNLPARAPVETVSPAAYPFYVQGMELLQRDDYNADHAIPLFQQAIAIDPRSALPYAALADAQIRKFDKREGPKWLDMAATNVAKAQAINADSVPVLLAAGAFQESHGGYEPALRAFTRATELDPGNPEAWRRLAGAYDKAGRTDDAIATYRRAIQAQPGYYGNYLSLGNLYWYRGEFRQADELYRRVTAIAPDLSTGHMNLGLALMEQGRFQEAEDPLQHALRLRRSSMALMNIGGLYYAEERYAEAVRYFEESVALGTVSAILYEDLGDAYRHLGRGREARQAYISARDMFRAEVTNNPRQADSRVMLALASALLGDARTAEFEASQALSMEPENAIVMREAVLTYEALHQRDAALAVLRRAPRRVLIELSRQPDAKSLQQDTRFQELM